MNYFNGSVLTDSLYPTKTKCTIADHTNNIKCNITLLNVSINNTVIQTIRNDCEEKATHFLGIYIDENFTLRHHIANANEK